MKTFDFKTISYSGKNKTNEDYISCHKLFDNSLIAVLADGMGGLSHGAEAAKIVSESILTTIMDKIQECSPEDVLRLAFDVADAAIHKRCRALKCKMGAAVTVALIMNDSLYYAWQGNVRLYKVMDDKLSLLTTDHIVADTEGTYLTRCVNGKGYRESVPVKQEKLEQVDKIYICSDGCYQNIDLNGVLNQDSRFVPDGVLEDDASLIEIKIAIEDLICNFCEFPTRIEF